MSIMRKLLRLNRRIVHQAYQAVFPIGVLVIGICGIIIIATDDKILDWTIDFSVVPVPLGYVFLYGSIIAVMCVNVELLRKSIIAVRRKFNWHKAPTLQQRIDETTK